MGTRASGHEATYYIKVLERCLTSCQCLWLERTMSHMRLVLSLPASNDLGEFRVCVRSDRRRADTITRRRVRT